MYHFCRNFLSSKFIFFGVFSGGEKFIIKRKNYCEILGKFTRAIVFLVIAIQNIYTNARGIFLTGF
jgi:hypothetical protein